MFVRNSLLALTILFLDWGSASSQQLPATSNASRRCEPIGLIINNGDRRWVAGTSLCRGDKLQSKPGAVVLVLCYLNGERLKFFNGVISDKCRPSSQSQSQSQAQRCTPYNRSNCRKVKGPSEGNNTPTLLAPYSNVILNTRPTLFWGAVSGANSYTVQISGKGINWEQQVENNLLPYPQDMPAMLYGNVYQVTIIAHIGDEPISDSSSVLIVLPESEAGQVIATVKQIKDFNLPGDEAAFALDVVYMSQDLLTEAITALTERVKVGSQNPTLYRLLGDRYLEAGLPDHAKQEYTTAAVLAKKSDNTAELAKAQAGLKRALLHSQLPTRTNVDQ